MIREALHNCIAHQDYGLRGRINVIETPSFILLSNVGSFLPGDIAKVIHQDAPLEIYRNPFLADAMVTLNMIDTQGGGIKRMFQVQVRRFFPLPDYDLSEPDRVAVTVRGEILDEQYSQVLMEQADLELWQVMLLDKVQKRATVTRDEHHQLKAAGVVEGRYPNLLIAGRVAKLTGQEARHIRERGFTKQYYLDLISALVQEHGPVSREQIDHLLLDKLPEVLTEKQKRTRCTTCSQSWPAKHAFVTWGVEAILGGKYITKTLVKQRKNENKQGFFITLHRKSQLIKYFSLLKIWIGIITLSKIVSKHNVGTCANVRALRG